MSLQHPALVNALRKNEFTLTQEKKKKAKNPNPDSGEDRDSFLTSPKIRVRLVEEEFALSPDKENEANQLANFGGAQQPQNELTSGDETHQSLIETRKIISSFEERKL